ncbi:hypothetical protein ANO11243_022550 [Dothideomycetidae sp. 11243]|nr:hypothetical protein ANO11243_022550 [fungal sp. No.11243]
MGSKAVEDLVVLSMAHPCRRKGGSRFRTTLRSQDKVLDPLAGCFVPRDLRMVINEFKVDMASEMPSLERVPQMPSIIQPIDQIRARSIIDGSAAIRVSLMGQIDLIVGSRGFVLDHGFRFRKRTTHYCSGHLPPMDSSSPTSVFPHRGACHSRK